MALSNTAVPIHYGIFRQRVLDGVIPVNESISLYMNIIDARIADPRMYYDDGAINGFVQFCEAEMTLTDGSDVELLDTFKLWAEDLLSWFYIVESTVYVENANGRGGKHVKKQFWKRLISKQFIITSRGTAKTMYLSFLQAYFLIVKKETTHQITTAPVMKLAEEVMSPIRTAITRSRGPLFKFLTMGNKHSNNEIQRKKLASTKKGIEYLVSNSLLEVRVMSIDKLQGLRPFLSTVDEWLSGDIKEDVIGAIEQGALKMDDYIIVAVSSEGTVRNGSGDTIKMELDDILRGKYPNPFTSIWHYKLDDISEIAIPEMWPKAIPNIGKTVTYENVQKEVERAESVPAARNDILAKWFGLAVEGFTYFFSYEETLKHKPNQFWGLPCALGADLSQGQDFCAFTFLFPLRREEFGVKTRSYITEKTLAMLPAAMKRKYEEFLKEGTLIVMDGNLLNMELVTEDLIEHIDKMNYDVVTMGYDSYNSAEYLKVWERYYGTLNIEKVIQGFKTESVPLGELKILAKERLLLFDEELMTFTMGNAVGISDSNGNIKLSKQRRSEKIDNVAALMDAYVAFKRHIDEF